MSQISNTEIKIPQRPDSQVSHDKPIITKEMPMLCPRTHASRWQAASLVSHLGTKACQQWSTHFLLKTFYLLPTSLPPPKSSCVLKQ